MKKKEDNLNECEQLLKTQYQKLTDCELIMQDREFISREREQIILVHQNKITEREIELDEAEKKIQRTINLWMDNDKRISDLIKSEERVEARERELDAREKLLNSAFRVIE